jgi:hypothetical protein
MNESFDAVVREILALISALKQRLVKEKPHYAKHAGIFRVGERWFFTIEGLWIDEFRDNGSVVLHRPWNAPRVCRAKYAVKSARDFTGASIIVLLAIRDRLRASLSHR